jgi:hypothetical protein
MKIVIRVFTIIAMVCLPIAFLIFDLVWGFRRFKSLPGRRLLTACQYFGGASSAQDASHTSILARRNRLHRRHLLTRAKSWAR